MSTAVKYVKVHPDVLVEWTYDSDHLSDQDYTIVVDSLNSKRSFALSYDNSVPNKERDPNWDARQLFQLDAVANRWGVADPKKRSFIQYEDHVAPAYARFDRVRLYFPINYTFQGKVGIYFGVNAYDTANEKLYGLSNYFIDVSSTAQTADIKFLSPPFPFQERLWGKCIELIVPSVYEQSRERSNYPLRPTPGTINYNLTGGLSGNGLSQTSPIFVDFRFIDKRESVLGLPVYTLEPMLLASFPQVPEYATLGVAIEKAADGDYFEIFGTYNGNTVEFDTFMDSLSDTGQRNYILFNVLVFEENILQDTITFRMAKEFNRKISFCPVLKYTNTTASIKVSMNIIDEVDNSTEVRTAEIGLLQNDVAKYGRKKLSINVKKALKPKVYVAKADQFILSSTSIPNINRRAQGQRTDTVIKLQPYPMLINQQNIVTSDITAKRNGEVYFGQGQLSITLHPFDNIIKLNVATEITATSYRPFSVDLSETKVHLSFRTSGKHLDIPLYTESAELDVVNGIYLFQVKEADIQLLYSMYAESDDFYIAAAARASTTVIYNGKYKLSGIKSKVKTTPVDSLPTTQLQTDMSVFVASPPVAVPPPLSPASTSNTSASGAAPDPVVPTPPVLPPIDNITPDNNGDDNRGSGRIHHQYPEDQVYYLTN